MNDPVNDVWLMLWGTLFGAIGLGFFIYGSRQKMIVPWTVGTALMIDGWFVSSTAGLLAIDIGLIAMAYFFRF